MGRILDEFEQFKDQQYVLGQTLPDNGNNINGYYATLASVGLHGEEMGTEVGLIVDGLIASQVESVRKGRVLGQTIADGLIIAMMFGVRLGRSLASTPHTPTSGD